MRESLPQPQRGHGWRAPRTGAACLLATALLLASPATVGAAPRCADPRDQSVFEIEALKTELMVVATTCREEDRYNGFVQRYQPQLAENARAFGQYFARGKGRAAGQRANDIYITNLANARSTAAHQLGSDFCPRNTGQFAEVMALPGPEDLPAYAAGKDLLPASLGACEEAAPPAAPARRGAAARSARR